MTTARLRLWPARLGAAAMLSAFAGAAHAASALDFYYERSVMIAADNRCRLFEPALAAALASAQAQARGAALRAGAQEADITRLRNLAATRAGAAPCNGPDIKTSAARVRTSFEGYSRLLRLNFPGEFADWKADRAASANLATWRMSQKLAFGPDRAIVGLTAVAAAPPALAAAATFADGKWPYSARLVFRDARRLPQPQIGRLSIDPKAKVALASRIPPRVAAATVLASSRGLAEPLMAPAGGKPAILFHFPLSAVPAIEALDPREAVAVEFLFSGQGGDTVRTAYVEVGDLAAGRAFLRAAPK